MRCNTRASRPGTAIFILRVRESVATPAFFAALHNS
jgi:hypothetical protein